MAGFGVITEVRLFAKSPAGRTSIVLMYSIVYDPVYILWLEFAKVLLDLAIIPSVVRFLALLGTTPILLQEGPNTAG